MNNKAILSPVVFAVTVWEGGSKCVDYYMTWRGKTVSNIINNTLFLHPYPALIYLHRNPGTAKESIRSPSFSVPGLT
jgi:hypothetical protein